MDYPGRLIAGLLVVVLVFIFPLQYIAQSNSESIDHIVDNRTHQLTDAIRDSGFLDKQAYDEYMSFLDTTGDMYDIEIQDIKPVKGEHIASRPIRRNIINTSFGSTPDFGGSPDFDSTPGFGSTPGFDSTHNTIKATTNVIQSFATHTHTDACFDGDKHAHTSLTGSCYTWQSHTHSGNTTYGGACYSPYYHSHSGSSSSGGGCYGGKNYHSHSGSSSSGGGCYGGKNYHSHSGSSSSGGGCYGGKNYHSHVDNCYTQNNTNYPGGTCGKYPSAGHEMVSTGNRPVRGGGSVITMKCSCGGTLASSKFDITCGKTTSTVESYYQNCGKTTSTVESYYQNCGKTTSTVESYYINCGKTTSTIEGYYLNCSKTGEYILICTKIPGDYYKGDTKVSPICHQVVTSISATNQAQTVDKGSPIVTTATATYLDGHTGTVNCTSNYNPNLVGNQIITLTYSGLVGNAKTTGTRTCTVNVTVKQTRRLTSIIVEPATQTISRYGMPILTVKANYDDGTSRIINSSEYSIIGFDNASIGNQNVTISYSEDGITRTTLVNVTVKASQKECPKCNHMYDLNPDNSDPGCPLCLGLITSIEVTPIYVELLQGEKLPITVEGIYNDGSKKEISGWTSNYNPQRVGIQIVTVEYQGYATDITVWVNDQLITCHICNSEYPSTEDKCPVCSEKLVGIDAAPKDITVMQYDNIPLTVTAYYADGSSREVVEWSIDVATTNPGTYLATVSYKGIVDTVSLTVLSHDSIECPICGAFYNLTDSPIGCPICSKELIGIEAYLTSGTNLVQLGTNPNIAIILIFLDEHREFATEGYTIEDYNSHQLGVQTIRVLYKSFTATIIVEVVNMLDAITCPNGHIYQKNSDDSDTGCPFCHNDEDMNSKSIIYFDITYTSEILDTVYTKGAYYFDEGNYISLIVTKRNMSLPYKLQETFFASSLLGRKRRFIYGGEVNKS